MRDMLENPKIRALILTAVEAGAVYSEIASMMGVTRQAFRQWVGELEDLDEESRPEWVTEFLDRLRRLYEKRPDDEREALKQVEVAAAEHRRLACGSALRTD